ncbi:hypothetical protein C7401_11516 [Paraburkholderia unamae]|uniref:hypothetical protein n=1 Tax=Paraburkholderia unamae TaxID=219649 RepID=UPI000DC222DD|nr:hypothetical protein [Paraburkholderia unamae]RAR57461.1 hypothetical protein C7401_11516 [Paraburkholderia unamae]
MKKRILSLAIAVAIPASFATPAHAEGCLKGAAVGGVAGHVAGKHGTAGAAAGCAVGHHEAAKKQKAASDVAASRPASQ